MNRQPTGPCQIHQDNARQIPRAAFHLLPATWLATMSVRKATNLDEARRSVVLPRTFAPLRIERRIQRQRDVAEGLEAVPLGATRRQRQHRTLAIKRLDRRFLVYATHRRLFLRIQAQINIQRRPLSCCMPRRICAPPPPLPLNNASPLSQHDKQEKEPGHSHSSRCAGDGFHGEGNALAGDVDF